MIHCTYELGQWRILKKTYNRSHAEVHFEDRMMGDFFNYAPKKGLYLCLESSIRKGSDSFHHGPGGGYRYFDF